jgi:hypothetical protein
MAGRKWGQPDWENAENRAIRLSSFRMVVVEESTKVAKVMDEAARNAMAKQLETGKAKRSRPGTCSLFLHMRQGNLRK